MKTSLKRTDILIIALLALTAFSYTTYRAYHLSFTHDESFTYKFYVTESFSNIIAGDPATANNHYLNTILMKLFMNIFGSHQFVLRLPSLLAHLAYLTFSFLMVSKIKNSLLVIGGFILLNFNPYFLDFFSLARGYALAHAFSLGSLYFLIRFASEKKRKFALSSIILAGLASLSIYYMLYFYAAIILVYNLIVYRNDKEQEVKLLPIRFFRNNIISIIPSVAIFFILFEPVRKLIKFNQLYGRGTTGFWRDTVNTLFQGSFYGQHYTDNQAQFVAYCSVALLLSTFFLLIFLRLKKKNIPGKAQMEITFWTIVMVMVVSLIHHYLLNAEFLVFRTTLFYYPLLILIFLFFFNLIFSFYPKWPVGLPVIVVSILLFFHFINSANKICTYEWIYDCNTQQMLSDVQQDYHKNKEKPPVKLAIHWTFEPSTNFYRVTKHYDWLKETDRNGFETDADYYYIYKEDSAFLYKTGKQIVKRYPLSNTILAKTPEKTEPECPGEFE